MSQEEFYTEEDPLEVYKREFKRKKAEERKLAAEKRLRSKKIEFKILSWINLIVLVAGIILVADYWLPSTIYKEEVISVWQEFRGGRRFKTDLSFIKTKRFAFDVPPEVSSKFDYEGLNASLTIEATPILKTVKSVSAFVEDEYWTWEPDQTIYNNVPYLPYIILLSSIFVRRRKEFNEANYLLSAVPPLLLGILILIEIFGV